MSLNSILKEKHYKIDFSKNIRIDQLINIDLYLNNEFSKPLFYRGFEISKKNGYFFIKNTEKSLNLLFLYEEISEYKDLLEKYNGCFSKLLSSEKFVVADVSDLLEFIYIDLYIYIEVAYRKLNEGFDIKNYKSLIREILPKVKFVNPYGETKKKEMRKRSDFLTPASLSYVWNRDKRILFSTSINKHLNIIEPVEFEIPYGYDKSKLKNTLKEFSEVLEFLDIKNRDFIIRFRKLGLFKRKGFYIKKAKTIIVDPRHTDTLYHELGHYIFEEGIPFKLNGSKRYKKTFSKIVEENIDSFEEYFSIHKIESHKHDSETFALWFENNLDKMRKKT
jgi:hypothetical protein